MNTALHQVIQRVHFAHGQAYDRHAAWVFGGMYRRVAADVEAAAPTGGIVLDAGCGSGRLAVQVARRRPDLRVHGVDLERGMVEVATRRAERENLTDRVEFTVADLVDLPLADGSVDLIVSTASLHHWTDVGAVIASLARVLRPVAGCGSTTSARFRPAACGPPHRTLVAAWTGAWSAPDGSPPRSSSVSRSSRHSQGTCHPTSATFVGCTAGRDLFG